MSDQLTITNLQRSGGREGGGGARGAQRQRLGSQCLDRISQQQLLGL